MAQNNVLQYVGARYVPVFYQNPNGTWDWLSGVQYEPLTIVKYGTSTYTSRQLVPATVGAPNTAPEYWALTGDYNGAILELTNSVNTHNLQLDGYYTLTQLGVPESGDATVQLQAAINKASLDEKMLIFDHDVSCTHLTIQTPVYIDMGGYKITALSSNIQYDSFISVDIQTLNFQKTVFKSVWIDANNITNCEFMFTISAGRHIFIDSLLIANVKTSGYLYQKGSSYSVDGVYIGRLRIIGGADNNEGIVGMKMLAGDSYISFTEINGFATNVVLDSSGTIEYNRDICFGDMHLWGVKTGMAVNVGCASIGCLILDSLSTGIVMNSPAYLRIGEIIDTLVTGFYFSGDFNNTVNVTVDKIGAYAQSKLMQTPQNFKGCLTSNPITMDVTISSGETLYATLNCRRIGKCVSVIVNGNGLNASQLFTNTIPPAFQMDRCPVALVPISDQIPISTNGIAYINSSNFYLRSPATYVFGVITGLAV